MVQRHSARPAATVDTGVLDALGSAVHAQEVLRFDYSLPTEHAPGRQGAGHNPGDLADGHGPGDAVVPPRRAEPHHLITWAGRWYLIAWDLDRADWRTFRADRIRPRTPTGPRFPERELPGEDVTAFVRSRFTGSDHDGCLALPG